MLLFKRFIWCNRSAAQCPITNVCFLYHSKLKLTKVSPESLPSVVRNLATMWLHTTAIWQGASSIWDCYIEAKDLLSLLLPWAGKKKKSHSVNSQSQSMRRNGRGNTSKKPLQLFHRYPKKWTTFLPGTHKSRVPLPFKWDMFWWKKREVTTASQCYNLVLSFGQSRDTESTNSRHTETQPFLHTHGWEGRTKHSYKGHVYPQESLQYPSL